MKRLTEDWLSGKWEGMKQRLIEWIMKSDCSGIRQAKKDKGAMNCMQWMKRRELAARLNDWMQCIR